MEELENNDILGLEDNEDSGSAAEFNSAPVPEQSEELENNDVTDEQIVNAIRRVINENNIEGDSLSDEPIVSPSVTPSVEPIEQIDYTDILNDINDNLTDVNTKLDNIIEYQSATIFDRELNDYNVTDSLIVFVVIFVFVKAIIHLIKVFTPKIWK